MDKQQDDVVEEKKDLSSGSDRKVVNMIDEDQEDPPTIYDFDDLFDLRFLRFS